MNKLIVTDWNGQILTALMTDGKCRSFHLEAAEEQSLLGTICIGKVQNIVKNINAAFIDLGNGKTGYYSLTENKEHFFAAAQQEAQILSSRKLKSGDEVVVQISKDAIKTKDPVLTSNLSFTGKYLVLTLGKTQLAFSNKIKDSGWKEEIRRCLTPLKKNSYGLIVRTNAEGCSDDLLVSELRLLEERLLRVLDTAPCRTCYSILEASEPSYIQGIRDAGNGTLEAILTDSAAHYEEIERYLKEKQPELLELLQLYTDPLLPLMKLYRLESVLDSALSKRVWLKSGGYLVIEPTEALTVIDVNTGKYSGRKNMEETLLKINLEAAVEIANQICLRNLSGIIIVDFIDMTMEEHNKLLLDTLEKELKKDPVKTVLVEMTKLGLVEITRKKVRKPLHEAAQSIYRKE